VVKRSIASIALGAAGCGLFDFAEPTLNPCDAGGSTSTDASLDGSADAAAPGADANLDGASDQTVDGAAACGPTTCPDGCCDTSGACVAHASQTPMSCGGGGQACGICPAGQDCDPTAGCVCNATVCGCCNDGTAGFVRSTHLTGTYDADPRYSFNSGGGTNHITTMATGQYLVEFPNLDTILGGNAQVTAVGDGDVWCKAQDWGRLPPVYIAVGCYDPTGTPANSLFSAAYFRRTATGGIEGGYALGQNPTATSYSPGTQWQWNSNGGSVTIVRTGPGAYTVTFPGQLFNGLEGTVEVSGVGADSNYCKVVYWSGPSVDVQCFQSNGAMPYDSEYSISYSQKSPNNIPSYAYLWANEPTAASYTPPAARQAAAVVTEPGTCGPWTPPAPLIVRTGAGRYTVTLPGLATSSVFPSNAQASAYGSGSEICKLADWSGDNGGSTANVTCFDSSGNAVDARFVLTFSSLVYRTCADGS
jgi:hypothetical protein